jgi:3-phenylpropionate/cinnamic acid dioxygenase small subunit
MDDVGASGPIGNQTAQRFDDWHAIQTLIMVYAELVDAGRFAEAAALFEHATYRLGYSTDGGSDCTSFRGAAEVNAHMARTPLFSDGTPRTRHVHTNLIVELQGDSATSRCYVTVFQQTDTFPLQPIAVGGYVDRFERVDGRWRFADRLVTSALVGNFTQHQAKA